MHAQSVDSLGTDSITTFAVDSNFTIDSTKQDSLGFSIANHKSSVTESIEYEAEDSIILNLQEKKAYLYGNAKIFYQDIKLNAAYIEIDFDKKDLFAKGIVNDTTKKYVGRPAFEDDGKIYEADTMRYNFESKKGISYGVLTTEKDGFIHGERVLRDSQENIYVKNARFTTCDLPEPHFYIKADKIKVIPKKQIVTGPANLVIADINTPLFVPFGFFPIPEQRKHGLIFPTFGESQERGFNLRGLGYYIPVNQYFDVQLTSDIYFRGSFGATLSSRYNRRYRYSGNLQLSFNRNEFGEPESSSYRVSNDYKINWTYRRDTKSKPGTNFSANVNFVTSSFLKNNTTDYQDIISTNSTSSVAYSRSFFKRKLNLSMNSNMSQNLTTGLLTTTLPQLTASVSRQLPFKNLKLENKTARSFLNNLGFSYQGTFKNQLTTIDTVLIAGVGEFFGRTPTINTPSLSNDFKNGATHSIPISTSFKALTWFTVSPSFNYNEFWYFKTTEKRWDSNNDTLLNFENVGGFSRASTYSASIGLSTILYGQKQFVKGKLRAIRHVVRPNIGANFSPDFSQGKENGYRSYIDSSFESRTYSIYENSIIGRPSQRAIGSLSFGLGNNLEIKVKSPKDTTNGGIKKVKIIESLNIGSSYNFLADSFNLARISFSGNTTILNKIRMNFGAVFDPYGYTTDSAGIVAYRSSEFAVNQMDKLGNFISSNITISTNLNPDALKRKTSETVREEELEFINNNIQNYIDFDLLWSLNLNYSLRAVTTPLIENSIDQIVTINGDINLTPNWKIGMNTGYNISEKEITVTSINLDRDLHCWQMTFQWYPIGTRQMFNFGINVKSSTLKDLKLNRRRSWFDF